MEFADAYFRQSKRIGFLLNLKAVSVRILTSNEAV